MSQLMPNQPADKWTDLDRIVKETFNNNRDEVSTYQGDIEAAIIRLDRKMAEITDVAVMLPIIKDPKKRHDWFDQVLDSYQADARQVMANFTDQMVNNNTIMLERLKIGLARQDFDGQKLSEKELYNIFDRHTDVLERRIKADGNAISYNDELFSTQLGSMEKAINRTIRRNRRVKRFWILLPAVIFLALGAVMLVSLYQVGSTAVEAVVNDPEIINSATTNLGLVNDFLKELGTFSENLGFDLKQYLSKNWSKGLKFLIPSVILPLVVGALGYFIYVKLIARGFAKKLKSKLQQLLVAEQHQFKSQQNRLKENFKAKMADHFVHIEKIYAEFLKEGLQIKP